jgi:hypothetical protein
VDDSLDQRNLTDHADYGDFDEDEELHHSNNDDAMNDFDDFEEGEHAAADDDFGDFDDGFQEPTVEVVEDSTASLTPQLPPTSPFVVSSLSTSINSSAIVILIVPCHILQLQR